MLEKRVTLAVAKALVEELNKIPGIRAVNTRDGDFFIPLRERYRIAERMNADLFVSIHANSSRRRGSGKGTEVYFLSVRGASDQATQDLADIENAADQVGGKNLTMMVRSMPGGGGRTSATFARASRAD